MWMTWPARQSRMLSTVEKKWPEQDSKGPTHVHGRNERFGARIPGWYGGQWARNRKEENITMLNSEKSQQFLSVYSVSGTCTMTILLE